ncbi:MAG: hypothetical protein IJV31_11870 [Clostridia bacterium]|nr:hypothetical protein [Clostridia bacterium]
MELKTKYQYTYFIYPYMVKENKYTKYLIKLLKNENCKLKLFEKQREPEVYAYFTPKIRNCMFSTFNFTKKQKEKLKELPVETEAAILAENPCTIFEYNIENEIQGKVEEKDGIFFRIQKLEIICFNTGICFLSIKTSIEDSEKFSDILNFNYKFKNINSLNENMNLNNIKIQTDTYENIQDFINFINELTGVNQIEIQNIDIDTQKFLTYSYACIEQSNWSNAIQFDNIKSQYIKFVKGLPNDDNVNYNCGMKIIDKWNYAKLGVTKQSVTLFSSSIDLNNYTIFPQEFESKYLYTYILALYIRVYLKSINIKFKKSNMIKKNRKQFLEFTKNIWIHEITNEDIGTLYFNYLKEVLELDDLYLNVKNEFDIFYKELNIEKNTKISIAIAVMLGLILICNIANLLYFRNF